MCSGLIADTLEHLPQDTSYQKGVDKWIYPDRVFVLRLLVIQQVSSVVGRFLFEVEKTAIKTVFRIPSTFSDSAYTSFLEIKSVPDEGLPDIVHFTL